MRETDVVEKRRVAWCSLQRATIELERAFNLTALPAGIAETEQRPRIVGSVRSARCRRDGGEAA
jgi:hypothetical protein